MTTQKAAQGSHELQRPSLSPRYRRIYTTPGGTIHQLWAIAAGGWLGVGNDATYNHADCFYKFPFPDATEDQKTQLRSLGEQLDVERQPLCPRATTTLAGFVAAEVGLSFSFSG